MQQKPTQEPIDRQSQESLLVSMSGISPAKRNLVIYESDETAIGYRHAVCVENPAQQPTNRLCIRPVDARPHERQQRSSCWSSGRTRNLQRRLASQKRRHRSWPPAEESMVSGKTSDCPLLGDQVMLIGVEGFLWEASDMRRYRRAVGPARQFHFPRTPFRPTSEQS